MWGREEVCIRGDGVNSSEYFFFLLTVVGNNLKNFLFPSQTGEK